jgi:conserved oligomeric Golgi complex subunit 4
MGGMLPGRRPSTEVGNDAQGEAEVPDVYNAASIAEIKAALSQLHHKEAAVTSRLDALVASQKDFQRELGRVDFLRANLSSQASKARSISNGMLADAAGTANSISSSVKKLDLEQSAVKATLEVVEQVAELKACVLGVAGSMGAPQDWETAASYLSRASKIPKEVINGPFAARVVPTAEVPDAPNVTLENASESLCGLFLREFDKAVKENDGSKITRFFKLFPLIDRSDVGLDVYGRYVCQGVAARARANLNAGTGGNQSKDGFFYANALTKLFEHIAQIVDGHGGLVERHYGAGKMTRVIERLQTEADVQGGIILDTWADERRIDRQLTEIRSYAYTFLVQSFLPVQRGISGTPRANSPANMPDRSSEDEGVDMKAVDALLNEMAVMLGRWSLYTRFLAGKCAMPPQAADGDSNNATLPKFLVNSTLMKKITDRLITPFNTMTTFFFRRSVEKAFQLDEQPPDLSLHPHKPLNSNPPHITSAVDDIMYIVNKVLQQSLATSQMDVVRSVVPTVTRVLSSDFVGMVQRKMRDESYPKAAIPGSLPPEHTIVAFLVLVNNLDVAMNYVSQIVQSHMQAPSSDAAPAQSLLSALFPSPSDAWTISTTLTALSASFNDQTSALLSDSVHVIFNNVMKPRLRPILLDAFRDTDYALSADELHALAQEEGRDDLDPAAEGIAGGGGASVGSELVRARFQHGWDALTKPIGRIMTDKTFNLLLTLVTSYLAKMLEKRLWAYHGRVNELGGVRLERDVNAIVKVVVDGKRYTYRDVFLKCTQICMVMNMEAEEWDEVKAEASFADRLSQDEKLRARGIVGGEMD